MVFSSLTFLYFFLPCVTILYYVCKNRVWRNWVLLVFSLVFYSGGEPNYILLLLRAAAEASVGGLIIDAAAQRPKSCQNCSLPNCGMIKSAWFSEPCRSQKPIS